MADREPEKKFVPASLALAGALTGWMAVLLQLYLLLSNSVESLPETIFRFLSYFTILTNCMVAWCFTAWFLYRGFEGRNWWLQSSVWTAVTGYICVVGLVYAVILRQTWSPEGLQLLVDEFLHLVMPVLFLLFWLLYVPKHTLQWSLAPATLLFPLLYVIFILIRGYHSGFYPYPFMDAGKLEVSTVLLNCFFMCLAFLGISCLLIGTGKLISGKQLAA